MEARVEHRRRVRLQGVRVRTGGGPRAPGAHLVRQALEGVRQEAPRVGRHGPQEILQALVDRARGSWSDLDRNCRMNCWNGLGSLFNNSNGANGAGVYDRKRPHAHSATPPPPTRLQRGSLCTCAIRWRRRYCTSGGPRGHRHAAAALDPEIMASDNIPQVGEGA